jgi:hypothetical protein
VFDVEDERVYCRDLVLMMETRRTRLWLPRLVRIAAAAANCSGSTLVLVIVSKSDPSPASSIPSIPLSPEHSPTASPGSSVNSIDAYTVKLVAVTTTTSTHSSSSSPISSSVSQAKIGMDAVDAQLVQLQQKLAALHRRRQLLPVIDPQEPRLRREAKTVTQRLADLQDVQRLLHRNCAAAVLGGEACEVVAEAALDSRCAMSMDFNLAIHADCGVVGLADLHLSAAALPDSIRQSFGRQGVCLYNSDKAVAVSADGDVTACSLGNTVSVSSRSSGQRLCQTLDLPNAVLALALHATGNLMAVAVTSLTGSR